MKLALRLALKFITGNAFMGFWTHLCTANLVPDRRPLTEYDNNVRRRVLEADPNKTTAQKLTETRTVFTEISQRIQFFFISKE
jgi:hypothetical protein